MERRRCNRSRRIGFGRCGYPVACRSGVQRLSSRAGVRIDFPVARLCSRMRPSQRLLSRGGFSVAPSHAHGFTVVAASQSRGFTVACMFRNSAGRQGRDGSGGIGIVFGRGSGIGGGTASRGGAEPTQRDDLACKRGRESASLSLSRLQQRGEHHGGHGNRHRSCG